MANKTRIFKSTSEKGMKLSYGKGAIQFVDGIYKTSDKDEIERLLEANYVIEVDADELEESQESTGTDSDAVKAKDDEIKQLKDDHKKALKAKDDEIKELKK